MYLTAAVVASWSLTQEMAGLNPFTAMTNIFVTEFSEFNEKFKVNSTAWNNRGYLLIVSTQTCIKVSSESGA